MAWLRGGMAPTRTGSRYRKSPRGKQLPRVSVLDFSLSGAVLFGNLPPHKSG